MVDAITLAAAKSYTDKAIEGGGTVQGKNCTISDISPITGGNRVTFEWTLDDGTVEHDYIDVMDGVDGQDGAPGATGPRGEKGDAGEGVVAGGTAGQVLAKKSGTDYDTEWITPSGGGSGDLTKAITAVMNVGGISVGKTYPIGTPLEDILTDMLAPVLYPTFTNPSASISAPGSKLLEVGATSNVTITVTFNRGSISPAYGTSGYRAGAASSYALNGGTAQAGNTFNVTVSGSNKSFTATVAYEAGEQPKDSSGADYDSPLAAGSVNTGTLSYEFVNAIWANTANITTVAKLALVSKSAKVKVFNFPAQTIANPEIFDVPSSWTVVAVEVLNTLNNQWEDCSSEFTTSSVTHDDAGGSSVNYTRYTDNRGYAANARDVRVRWS